MKLTIERAAILRSLAHVQSVVERRNAIPILANVLIDASEDTLSLSATDMDIDIVDRTPAEVQTAGAVTAPVHTLYDIVRKLPDGAQVELSLDGDSGQMALRAGRSNFTLSTLPKEDFPAIGEEELSHSFRISADGLRQLIDRTRFAISTEETRYYLNGIYLHAAEDDGVKWLRGVATDGHRLAKMQMSLPDGADGMPSVIFPRKAVGEVRRLIDESGDDVTVSLSENKIRFEIGSVVLTSKVIDGTFPDYQRVIPTGNDKQMDVDAKTFREAVDRVSTISTEKSRAIKLALSEGGVTLQATSPEAGSASEDLEASYDADGLEIGFNSKYLLDIAGQVEGDTMQFVLADAASPTIVKDVSDASALYVLMPMRV